MPDNDRPITYYWSRNEEITAEKRIGPYWITPVHENIGPFPSSVVGSLAELNATAIRLGEAQARLYGAQYVNERLGKFLSEEEHQKLLSYLPALSIDTPGHITYVPPDRPECACYRKRVSTRIGRLCTKLGITLSPQAQASWDRGFADDEDVFTFHLGDAALIPRIYERAEKESYTHSCMSDNPKGCLGFYSYFDTGIAWAEEDGKVVARILVWNCAINLSNGSETKLADRPYGKPEAVKFLLKQLEDKGYVLLWPATNRSATSVDYKVETKKSLVGSAVPYIDTFDRVSEYEVSTRHKGESITAGSTVGARLCRCEECDTLCLGAECCENCADLTRCHNCDCRIHEGEETEVAGEYYCESCAEDFTECDNCGNHCSTEDTTEVTVRYNHTRTWCQHCVDSKAIECPQCGEYVSGSYTTILADEVCVCDSCVENHCADCEECGGLFLETALNENMHCECCEETKRQEEELRRNEECAALFLSACIYPDSQKWLFHPLAI